MPTPLKKTTNMTKHLTKAEKEARQAAETELEPKKQPYIMAPDWLSKEARQVFERTKKKMRDFQILDSADADLLALYADAVARYQAGVKTLTENTEAKEIQAVQSWSRLALSYAEKLGISPTAKARLAKRKAEREPVDPMAALLGDVEDYVNGGQ